MMSYDDFSDLVRIWYFLYRIRYFYMNLSAQNCYGTGTESTGTKYRFCNIPDFLPLKQMFTNGKSAFDVSRHSKIQTLSKIRHLL